MSDGTTPPVPPAYVVEEFTAEERSVLARHFTSVDGPVFALVGLPEVVKGALFARYSRSPKSVRRLFLDEFYDGSAPPAGPESLQGVDRERAERLYQRVFTEYGDDSVAQLGGAHLACEQASNILTKVLEWGRLASYLEQSTRYIFYDRPLGGRYRYHVPPEIAASSFASEYRAVLDSVFDTYRDLTDTLSGFYRALYPQQSGDSDFVYRSTIRAKACDDLRGLLPAATVSNVGIYASGQAYEALLLRMRAHPLGEVRSYADLILHELRSVIPSFVRRVDVPERGGAWSAYLAETAGAITAATAGLTIGVPHRPEVTLVEWDPDAETKIAAAALYAVTDAPDDALLDHVRGLSGADRAALIAAYVGERGNRRHRPGRAMERSGYRFDLLTDYGIFRDLQRHRLLTIEWQRLGTDHGYIVPEAVTEVGAEAAWRSAMERTADLHGRLTTALGPHVAQYAVPFAYRVRYVMQLNAREAFHLLELRTARGGHAGYRRVCQEMHRQIRDVAGHRQIADAMRFVDHEVYELERLESERAAAARRAEAGLDDPA